MDLVTVIVPVYNVEKYLDRCMKSILTQSYSNLEIILVDDGSTDSSGKLCDKYKQEDERVKVVHKENAGLGYARNSGLDIATGKYVTFIDSDDYIGSDHVKIMYDLIVNNDVDTCVAGHTKVYATSKVEHKNVCAGKIYRNSVKEILPRMCGRNSNGDDYIEMSVCMVMYSNEIIKAHNLRFKSERELISEDLVFNFDYHPYSKGAIFSDLIDYYYCDNEGSLTTKYRPDRFSGEEILYKTLLEKIKQLGIEEECIPRLNNTLIAIARYCIKLEYKFASVNGKKIAARHVKDICENDFLVTVMNSYDDSRIKRSSRIVNYMMKNKMYFFLAWTMKFKNKCNI